MDRTAITGIHHLTAISGDAQRTLDFYTGALGLRLVKQTITGAAPATAEIWFGDDAGRPGSLVTFITTGQASPGRWGIGGTHHLAFRVADPAARLRWKRRLIDLGYAVTGPFDRVYFTSIYFEDPDGLILEIATAGPGWTVDEPPDQLGTAVQMPPTPLLTGHRDEAAIAAQTWPEPVPAIDPAMRLERIHHITAIASDAAATERFYTETLGLRLVKRTVNFDNPTSPHLYFGVGDGAPGTIITYFAYPRGRMRTATLGTGLTHHFALAVSDEAALRAWHERLAAAGVAVGDVQDHHAYQSLIFTDPDGHPLELATAAPAT